MIKKGYIETPSGAVHFRSAGDRAMPCLLLLHQTASSSAMYEGIMRLLADDYWIFAPDTPGFGGSDSPSEPASMRYYAAALRYAMDAFGLTKPFVFGHHTGASIAVQMEFDRPVAQKMILSGPPYLTLEQKAAFKSAIEPIVLNVDGTHLQKLWQRLRAKDESAELALTHREFLLNLSAGERYHEAYTAVFEHDFETQLARLECPILVTAGDRDTLRGSLEPALAVLRCGSVRYAKGNTFICDQSPELMADVIREYFNR